MYAWIWNHLPGPTAVRLILCLIALGMVVAVLFTTVFPWLEPRLPFTDVTVESSASESMASLASTGLSTGGEITTML
jgi:hypothetical protein